MVSWEQAGDAGYLEAPVPPEPLFVDGPGGVRHPSPLPARAFISLIRAGQALERLLDSELRHSHRLGLHDYEVLLHLAVFSSGGTATMSRLAAQTPLSQSRVSRLVAAMEVRGLLRRVPCEGDARRVDVQITEAGLERLRQAQEVHHAGLERHLFAKLPWDDLVQLARLLAKLDLVDGPPPGTAP